MDENEKEGLINEGEKKAVSRKLLNWIYGLFIASNIIMNLDHGIIPACLNTLKQEPYNYDSVKLGLLGTLLYVGLTFGNPSSLFCLKSKDHFWVHLFLKL
jgi:hypothetical protein